MIAFVTIVAHFAVSYLHVLLAWQFFPRRHEDQQIYLFWVCMVMWSSMHLFMGLGLLLEAMSQVNAVYYATKFLNQVFQAYLMAIFIPLLMGELRQPPEKPNLLASGLMIISRNTRFLFYVALGLATLQACLMRTPFYPEAAVRQSYGNEIVGRSMVVLGAVWFLMLVAGIRPIEKSRRGFAKAIRAPFAIMFLLLVSLFLGDFWDRQWSLFPIISSLAFSFSFSWHFFRLQFLDVILNQTVSIVMLILISTGLGALISSDLLSADVTIAHLTLLIFLLVSLWAFNRVHGWFSQLWLPTNKVLQQVHVTLPALLARCDNKEAATKETMSFVATTFHCQVCINDQPDFDVANTISLSEAPGRPVIMRLGYIRNWIPWFSQANSWAKTVSLYLQSYLQILETYENQVKAEELSALAARSALNAMRAQIRPHFLFNTLNSIHNFVRENPAQAEEVIERLSELMRSALSSTDEDTIPLEQELDTVRNYLAIEQARFGDRLHFSIETDPGLSGWYLPPFSIQPLAENAIKHGLETQLEAVNIKVEAHLVNQALVIKVIDDGGQLHVTGSGLGLATKNVSDRLLMLYGERASLTLANNQSIGVTATLTIPHDLLESNQHAP